MEAILMMNSTGDNKHRFTNPNRNFYPNRTLFPYPSDNLLFSGFLNGCHVTTGGGYLSMPPASLSNSYSPAVSGFRSPSNLHHYRQQPPLLPLPISTPLNHQNMNNMHIARSYSGSNNNIRLSPPRINQINKNVKNRGRDHSLTPKKSKNQKKDSKREVVDPVTPAGKCPTESSINDVIGPDQKKDSKREVVDPVKAPTESNLDDVIGLDLKKNQKDSKSEVVDLVPQVTVEVTEAPTVDDDVIGPDPKEVVIARVYTSSMNKSDDIVDVDDDRFSGSVMFTPSPPPSSLPLPTFFLRPKVSCKAEAVAGVDVGATDSLRRLLRL